jgi:hypothetical protein
MTVTPKSPLLAVIGPGEPLRHRGKSYPRLRCRCVCGGTVDARAYDLTQGKVWSCGCQPPRRSDDLSGQRFGKLTVLRRAVASDLPAVDARSPASLYLCRCACGAERMADRRTLRGTNPSCGCARSERAAPLPTGTAVGTLVIDVLVHDGSRRRRLYACRCTVCHRPCTRTDVAIERGTTCKCAAPKPPPRLVYEVRGERLTIPELAAVADILPTTLRARIARGMTAEEAAFGARGRVK